MDKKKGTKSVSWRKLIVLISIFIILILFPIVLYLYFSKSPEGVAWIDPSWIYRKSISVSNSGSELTNEDVLVTIDTEALIDASKLQPDCDDLRFTDSDESTALDYWVEGGCDSTTTRVWVQIPTLPNGGKTIYVYYGNASATNAEETWTGTFIALNDEACPAGWARDTNFDNRFPYGSATAGTTGGSSTHMHTKNGTTSAHNSSCQDGTGQKYADGDHSYSTQTAESEKWAPYADVVYCGSSDYNPYAGMVTLFDAAVPSGWTRFSTLDSVFPRGAASYGGTGGGATHTHSFSGGTTGNSGSSSTSGLCFTNSAALAHTHSFSMNTSGSGNILPTYKTVIWGEAEGATVLSEAIFMVTANPPLGWVAQTAFNGYFFYGAETFGTTGGAATHTHSVSGSTGTTSGSNCCGNSPTSSGFDTSSSHSISGTSGSASNIQPYYSVIVSKRKTSQSATLGGEESSGPLAPTIGTPTALSTTSIRWNFTDNSSDELGFKVLTSIYEECSPPPPCPDPFDGDEIITTCETPDISYCDVTGLSPNTEYISKVFAYNGSGNSPFSDTATRYTLVSAPTISYGGNKTASTIYLQSSDAINGSEMYFDCTGTGCDTGINEWVSSTNDLAESLSSNTVYNFRVMSRNGDNVETEYSDTIEIYTLADVPGLELNAAGSTSMQLTGSINNIGVGSTALYFDCTGLNCDEGINTWSTEASQLAINLLPNTQYAFVVKGRNYDGTETEYSGSSSKYTLTDIPIISGEALSSTSIKLESSVDNVEYGDTGLYFDCTGTGCDTGINEWLKDTEDTATDLTPNTGYTFVAKSRNADAVESSNSDPEEIYTLAQVPSISVSEVSDTTVSLQAGSINNLAVGQSGVYFDCVSANCDSGINEWLKSDTDVSINLTPNTQYTFRVKARNSDAIETAYSDTVSIYTGAIVPNAPEILSASTQSITVRVKSDSNPSSTTYTIYEEITGKYVNYSTNALVSSPVWGTRVQFGSDTGTLINGLSTGTAYKFKVKAKNIEDVETSYSSTTSTATLLNTPTAGSASNISASSVTWNFTDTNSNESGVRVYNDSNQLVKECSGSNITSCTETGLNANVNYRRYLKAYNAVSSSASSQVITAITLGEPTTILSLVNSTYNSVIMSLSPAGASTVQINEPTKSLYFNGSLGVLSSLTASVPYASSITIEGLLPNALYTFRVKSFNANGIETSWSSNQSITTFAQVPSVLSVQRVSSDTVRVFINNLYNPTGTQFSIKEVNSGKYLDYQTGTLETAEKWGTFTEYGESNGVLVRNIDPSLQYGFSARARNSENVNTSFSDAKYIGTKAILINVPSTIKVALTQDEKVVPTEPSNALYGEQSVRMKSGEYMIADVPVVFSRDRNWASVVADIDTKNYKAVVKFRGDTGVEKPFTLYVLQGETNSLVVCPNATAIEDISVDCTGGIKFIGSFPQTKKIEGKDVSVSQVILSKVKYWVADGLVGTGAQGYISKEGEEEPKQGGGIIPQITFQPVINGISNVINSVAETTISVLDNTPVKDLSETELKSISVATSVVTIAVSTGVMLGSLPQIAYLLIQTVLGVLSALGFRRKRVYYGYVYDSYSKEPVDAAIIRIYNTEKSLIETAITDVTGKFFGNLPQGEYVLEVKKRGYIFPSSYIKGEDYPIQNVYRGSINISDTKSELEVAIPMDREELSGSRKLFISFKKIFSMLLSILNVLIFIGGIFIFIYMYSKYPNTGNLLIGFIYIPAIYFIGRSILGKYMNYGKVVDRKGNRMKDISVVLKDNEFNRTVNKRVTDEKGRYRFVVNKGVYLLDIDEANYKVDKIEKGNDIEIKKNNGIISRKIIVKKS